MLSKHVDMLVELGYSVRVFEICHSAFCEKVRLRLYIVAVSHELGHAAAANFIDMVVGSVVSQFFDMAKVRLIPDIIDPDAPEEATRRSQSQVHLGTLVWIGPKSIKKTEQK